MKAFLRKLRGALGLGVTWGVSWALIGLAIGVIIGIVDPDSIDPGESRLVMSAIIGLIGFISGLGFGLVLGFTERRKSIIQLSLGRAALWGMLGAAALPLLTTMSNTLLYFVCPLGAVFAAGSVALARRAERRLVGAAPNVDRLA